VLRLGTSGWSYKHWTGGVFYPTELPAAGHLRFYADRFDSVEINYSFYQLPDRARFESWRRQTPPAFLFAVKGSRFLTHMKRLREPEEPLERLMRAAGGLGPKLGPILFQLPARFRRDDERLDRFLEALARHGRHRFAFEFRHVTWLVADVYERLRRADAALCLPVGWGIPLDARLTASWTYIRFHGGEHGVGFADDELRPWVRRIRGYLDDRVDVYAYFNNDPNGEAVRDAERLRGLVGGRAGPTPRAR
jgi:uncharacterized protein YecE (DUF72 family)